MGDKASRYLRNTGAAVLGSIAGTGLGLQAALFMWDGVDDPFGVFLFLTGFLGGACGGVVALAIVEGSLSRVERWWSWGSAASWFAIAIIPTVIVVHMTVQIVLKPIGHVNYLLIACVVVVALASTALGRRNAHDWIEPS